jgi:RNA 3'-terminal phosphate cyclase (ATP)
MGDANGRRVLAYSQRRGFAAMADALTLDGTHGEGGGQILRTALSLSAILVRPFRIVNIRAYRPQPGLKPQHLAAVHAAATITGAAVAGDVIGSTELQFVPSHPPWPGRYLFDVVDAAQRGSAGSVTLILQTLIVPLAMAAGNSTVVVRGGTHVEWSPSFDFLTGAYLPALARMRLNVGAHLVRWGWYPVGCGEVVCDIRGAGAMPLHPLEALGRGALRAVRGRSTGTNVPAHVPQQMANRAQELLSSLGVPVAIEAAHVPSAGPGAGLFLLADFEALPASFSAYGRRGKPSEVVAEEAVAALLEHHRSGAAVESHLSDQLLLPLAFAAGPSTFTVAKASRHLMTNAWTIRQFGLAEVTLKQDAICRVTMRPQVAAFRAEMASA